MLRVLRNLLFGALTAGALLGAIELGLRVAGWPDPGIYDGDLAGLWTLRANLPEREVPFKERGTTFRVRTNAHGWRGGAVAADALLCLGDSTTFGWGVEESEAWPARLAEKLGIPVNNGGVPGYTTHQARLTIDAALTTKPRRVLLSFLVRDADRAPMPDAERPTPRPPPALQLLKAVRALRPRSDASPAGPAIRVPPEAYVANLRDLVARVRAAGSEPVLLAFPMVAPPGDHLAALATVEGVAILRPELPSSAFFAEDPVHLTPAGNDALAGLLADALR
jgi:lysophospholipase L1-like esterase